ncbi:MAG TPA: DUF2934 domain-containing protein [Bryobacteraceae bacterium]|jgi:hypothetical protein|nr:DUF2934 domain-containing protein [Bryobacteraceae bacterium]
MQLNKASKKTRNIAEETKAPAPEKSAAVEVTANPRTTRSSKTKKTESTETGPVKHRHNKVNSATSPDVAMTPAMNTKAAAAGVSNSIILDAVGVVAPTLEKDNAVAFNPEVGLPHEEIAKLAYSYWIARGHSHGGAEEDWLRAERELRQRR